MRTLLTTLLLVSSCKIAAAHAGHGLTGAHWHASDLFGPALLLALAGAALWWNWRE